MEISFNKRQIELQERSASEDVKKIEGWAVIYF